MPSSESAYLTLAAAALIVVQGSNWHYMLYIALSIYMWDQAIRGWRGGGVPHTALANIVPSGVMGWVHVAAGVSVLELMILGFADRTYYTPCHILVGVVGFSALGGEWRGRWAWAASCCGAAVFTLLSVEFGDEMRLVYLGGTLLVAAALAAGVT